MERGAEFFDQARRCSGFVKKKLGVPLSGADAGTEIF